MNKYKTYQITGRDDGKAIKPYEIEIDPTTREGQSILDYHLQCFGDMVRYYEEVKK